MSSVTNTAMVQSPIMRTIKELVKDIKTVDPKSCIAEFYIRKLVDNKLIKYKKAGSRVYVDVESFYSYMNKSDGEN